MKKIPLSVFAIAALLALASPREAAAATCAVSVFGLNFGSYDPLSLSPTDSSTNLEITCSRDGTGTESVVYDVKLSAGNGAFDARRMLNGSHVLFYNLYAFPGGAGAVWGDGASSAPGVSGGMSPLNNATPSRLAVHPVYGRIAARQNVPAGSYADTIMVTVDY